MKGKIIAIVVVIVLLFAGLWFANNYKNKSALEGVDNPYDKSSLKQETIDLIGDPLYDNIIVPDDLEEEIDSGQPVTVYFFSPTCSYCQATTPVLVPLVEEMDIDMKKLNTLEYGMDQFQITGTPTLVHYDEGKEVARIIGQQTEDDFRAFFDEFVK
ncbi:MAG TPA: thioredoxin family protein [Pseudogracilibacillus sp.]|nr:thioredoxin family protein [Pseudogracilibacillus sp.]